MLGRKKLLLMPREGTECQSLRTGNIFSDIKCGLHENCAEGEELPDNYRYYVYKNVNICGKCLGLGAEIKIKIKFQQKILCLYLSHFVFFYSRSCCFWIDGVTLM